MASEVELQPGSTCTGLEVVGWEVKERDEGITEEAGGLWSTGPQRVGKTEAT